MTLSANGLHHPAQALHLDDSAPLWLWNSALPQTIHHGLQAQLAATLPWHQARVTVFGKSHLTPRLTCWQGDQGVHYRYSGHNAIAAGWHASLLPVLEYIQQLTGRRFNSALANLYRDGNDSMGYHSDDEPELGNEPWIASLSLGASRDFVFRPRSGGGQCLRLALADNSLLLMGPGVQHRYQHALPRRAKVTATRINVTFRLVQPQNA